MHWRKNRLIHPEAKDAIIQTGECPGCGAPVKFYYVEPHWQVCLACRKPARKDCSCSRVAWDVAGLACRKPARKDWAEETADKVARNQRGRRGSPRRGRASP